MIIDGLDNIISWRKHQHQIIVAAKIEAAAARVAMAAAQKRKQPSINLSAMSDYLCLDRLLMVLLCLFALYNIGGVASRRKRRQKMMKKHR